MTNFLWLLAALMPYLFLLGLGFFFFLVFFGGLIKRRAVKLRICSEEEYLKLYNKRSYGAIDKEAPAEVRQFDEEFDRVQELLEELFLAKGLEIADGDEGDFSIYPAHNYTRFVEVSFQTPELFSVELWESIQNELRKNGLDWMVLLELADTVFVTQSEVIGYSEDEEDFLEQIVGEVEVLREP